MNRRRLFLAFAMLLSSNTLVSAQFSLRSLIDGLKSTGPSNDLEADPQGVNSPPSFDVPSLQSDQELAPPAIRERVDLDSLPQAPSSQTLQSKDSQRPLRRPDTFINEPQSDPSDDSNTSLSNLTSTQGMAHPRDSQTASHSGGTVCPDCVSQECNSAPGCVHRRSLGGCDRHPRQRKPIVCLDSPNLPPPVSNKDLYRTPLHYNNLWGDYLNEQVKARRKAYGLLLAPPKSIYTAQENAGGECRQSN